MNWKKPKKNVGITASIVILAAVLLILLVQIIRLNTSNSTHEPETSESVEEESTQETVGKSQMPCIVPELGGTARVCGK